MYLTRTLRAAASELHQVVRAGTPTHGALRDRLVTIAVVTIELDLICAALALLFEAHASNTQIQSYGSALFWTSTQLLTVSSQLQNPFSLGGRILDVGMEAYAITIVATLAGSIGSFMVKRARELEQAAKQNGLTDRSSVSAPASSTACRGFSSSTCSTPSVAMIVTFFPFSSSAIGTPIMYRLLAAAPGTPITGVPERAVRTPGLAN